MLLLLLTCLAQMLLLSGTDPRHGMRQHDAAGYPLIDKKSFPDTAGMVSEVHALGLSAGWYLNGCKCGEHAARDVNYAGDIEDLHAFNFDGVKIDGCGAERNMTLYAQRMRLSGKNYTIENCHWGRCTASDDSSCPTREWCPFNWYRTSGDINAGSSSWLGNLQTTIRFQDEKEPLSQPGCWAYPDMLEVGRVVEPVPGSFYSWNRAHFGAWAIISAPLILGLALTDEKLDPVLDIIGNTEAIAINQAWAGHPGRLVESIYAPPLPYDPRGAAPPSDAAGDFELFDGATFTPAHARKDNRTSGTSSIRTGGPGQTSLVAIGPGFLAPGYAIDTVSLSFRYAAGYTPAAGQTKKAAAVSVVLISRDSRKVLKTLATTPPLGAFSWDVWTSYSPPITVHASDVGVPNDAVVSIALQVSNHDRNLQIPVDDLSGGLGVKLTWKATAGATAGAQQRVVAAQRGDDVQKRGLAAVHWAIEASAATTMPLEATAADAPDVWVKEEANVVVAAVPPHRIAATAGVGGQGQLWSKPMPGGGAAALLINASPNNISHTLNISKLGLRATGGYKVRDLWARADLPSAITSVPLHVPGFDSAFLLLTPA